jgi:hypothetical protein
MVNENMTLMKKIYNKPAIITVVTMTTGMLMNSVDQRGWTMDGTFYEGDGTYDSKMGASDHDVSFNLWEQDDDGWVDID